MTFHSALSFFTAIFIFSITPGPGVFAILSRALLCGAPSCLLLALGMVISDILYLLMASFGLAQLAEQGETAFLVIRLLGALYLGWLGITLWRAARSELPQQTVTMESPGKSFLQGFAISASNPKVILFYIAFLPTFIDLTALTRDDILLAVLLTFSGLLIGLMLVAYGAAAARRCMQSPRGSRILHRISGTIMIGAGLYLGSTG